jgi:hypothetical protein
MKLLHGVYPSLVGVLLGLLQTGLFFQLSFALSSSFRTFLMVTVAWLVGSAVGTRIGPRKNLRLNDFLAVALLAYFVCAALPLIAPFRTDIWFVYAGLIALTGLYPGVFFVHLGAVYPARTLFFRENNGFILGLVGGTVLFLIAGRLALWIAPVFATAAVVVCTRQVIEPTGVAHQNQLVGFEGAEAGL